MTETATIYEERDNSFIITLQKEVDGVPTDLTELEMQAITKYEIRYQNVYYNSVDNADAFSVDDANAAVTIKPYTLGLAYSGLEGELTEFIVYDAGDYTKGLVWSQFTLIVKKDAKTTG